jgi:WD40 repeat protein
MWDLMTGSEGQRLARNSTTIQRLAWRADGGLLVDSAATDGAVRLWSMNETGPKFHLIQVASTGPVAMTFSPEGRHVATGNPDGTVSILRLAAPGEAFSAAGDP